MKLSFHSDDIKVDSNFSTLNLHAELNQGLIMSKGGGQLLAKTAFKTDDPQTLRMVAGALANLCGNGKRRWFCNDRVPFPYTQVFWCMLSMTLKTKFVFILSQIECQIFPQVFH
jgi:hypothetical protein